MAHQSNFIGKKYSHLTIKSMAKYRGTVLHVSAICDCGFEGVYILENIERGKIKSCGCMKKRGSKVFEENVKNRIESLIEISGECWIWNGHYRIINGRFYPYLNSHKIQYNPIRWFYEQSGKETHKNWCFVRQCESEKCVNPDHHVMVMRKNLKKATTKEIQSEYIKRGKFR